MITPWTGNTGTETGSIPQWGTAAAFRHTHPTSFIITWERSTTRSKTTLQLPSVELCPCRHVSRIKVSIRAVTPETRKIFPRPFPGSHTVLSDRRDPLYLWQPSGRHSSIRQERPSVLVAAVWTAQFYQTGETLCTCGSRLDGTVLSDRRDPLYLWQPSGRHSSIRQERPSVLVAAVWTAQFYQTGETLCTCGSRLDGTVLSDRIDPLYLWPAASQQINP